MNATTHPATRAIHHVTNAAQIAVFLRDVSYVYERDADRIVALLADVPADIAALRDLIGRMEEDQRALNESSLAAHRQLNAEREKTAGLFAAMRELTRWTA